MHSLRRSSSVANGIRYVTTSSVSSNNEDLTGLKPWTEIPGPSKYSALLPYLIPEKFAANRFDFTTYDLLYKKYGPIVKIEGLFGAHTMIMTIDAEASAQVLRSENWLPIRPGFESLESYRKNKSKDTPDLPTGLTTDHGEIWRKFRSTVNPILMQPRTIKLYSKTLDDVAEVMMARIRSKRNEKNMVDNFNSEMNLWSLESIGVIALGRRLHCLDTTLPNNSPVRQLINTAHEIFILAEKLEFRPNFWRYIKTPMYWRIMKLYEELERLTKYFIEETIVELKTREKRPDNERSVLEKLLEIDERMAVIMASDMLFAGVDTTSNSVMATLYLLATNPDKQEKLRREIIAKNEKQYLRACVKEAMRMMPVVAGNLRMTSKEYNLLGYKIPKDTYLFFPHQYLSMMENNFPRSKEFIPERWIADKNDPLYYGKAHPFAFNPFGFGARSCIGRRIAELEIETFVNKAVENFQLEWVGPPVKIKGSSLNYILGPFNYVFKDRLQY